MKLLSLPSISATVALFAAAVLTAGAAAQAPQGASPETGGPLPMHRERQMPAPKNLKVLPKNLTGQQVHEIMDKWAGSLGVHCDTCHAADPNKVGPNGRPRLDFAADTKKDKLKARIMYSMTQDINKNYVSMVAGEDDSDAKVTCGTCHRGHLKPETYVIPREEHRGPEGMPPGMGAPPQQH